jgi:hypothetical protein
VDPPIPVNTGDMVSFHLHRPEFGEWTWTVETNTNRQKHSTFLSQPVSSSVLQKKSDTCKAVLNEKGQIALQVLQKLDGTESTADIAAALAEQYPHLFPDNDHARRFVISLVERFT